MNLKVGQQKLFKINHRDGYNKHSIGENGAISSSLIYASFMSMKEKRKKG
jgi:hypothetical protein